MNKGKIILIWLLIVLLLGVIGFCGYRVVDRLNGSPSEENNVEEKKEETEISYNSFSYDNYSIELINKIKDIDKIYAIDVEFDAYQQTSFDIYARYEDESVLKIATINPKESLILEYRALDVENNKLYFMITSVDIGTVFETHYISFNNLSSGAKNLKDFDSVFIKDNLWQKDDVYPSKIYVKGSNIYYTSCVDETLNKYNLKSKQKTVVLNLKNWYSYYIDKINNKIFYEENGDLYLSDLNGKNSANIVKNGVRSSLFWTNLIYDNKPVFEVLTSQNDGIFNEAGLYVYDYNTSSFKRITNDTIGYGEYYKVMHNNIKIVKKETKKEKIVESFFTK